ncbi:hypothetical protein J6590_081615 [Homalodisca vitripennis]|nr:hypothetical protein J6590_081615 [Homalodisca vitripennis]
MCLQEKIRTSGGFAKLVTSSLFVDKTLLIKAWFEDKNFVLLTAPRRSGKSMLLSMLKHFLEIPVDERGTIMEINSSLNYKLFKEKSFNIFKEKAFFSEHFGRYPVVFVEFKRHSGEITYKEVLDIFRRTLRNIFIQHKYLLYHKYMWLDEVELDHFNDYLYKKRRYKLSPPYLIKALSYLCQILKMHYGRRAIVLIDNYDALIDTLDLRYNPDIHRIISFLERFYTVLLGSVQVVERTLMTGLYQRQGVTNLPSYRVLPRNIPKCNYLDDRPFCNIFRSRSSVNISQ